MYLSLLLDPIWFGMELDELLDVLYPRDTNIAPFHSVPEFNVWNRVLQQQVTWNCLEGSQACTERQGDWWVNQWNALIGWK